MKGYCLTGYGYASHKRDNFTCQYCGFNGNSFPNWLQLTVDHILPISCGGDKKDPKNLITCCHQCNCMTSRMKFGPNETLEQIKKQKKDHVKERHKIFYGFWQENVKNQTSAT
ncbi:MAG: HNH endonuclease [Bacteroidota bacterium]